MRYLMIVQYDGKNYNGFQRQKQGKTIEGELETAILTLTKQKVNCVASGRTDAKVSAYHQPVHFEVEEEDIYAPDFIGSINAILPADIKVLSLEKTTLHARFSAKKKTYVYKMYVSQISLPMCANRLQIRPVVSKLKNKNFNFKVINKFCKLICGTHDFKGFQASGSPTETTVRTIYSAKLKKDGQNLNFYVTGNGFLYKMVRNLVGTMLSLGEGKLDFNSLKKEIWSTYKCTRTAPPEFLYLKDVIYK